ncbi:MAG: spore coat protein [Peptococcaceae bacterium]|nr:spore coat protein [Peptococcaceae bacterium]
MEQYVRTSLSDQTICGDLLTSAKMAVKSYATALTEATTPQVRDLLRRQLDDAISSQEKIFRFMEKKGWYKPFDINAQIQMDIQSSQKAINEVRAYMQ